MGPTGDVKVLQIHPSRRCNLRCLHCYSSSSPTEQVGLAPGLLGQAISEAAEEGYNWVSFSGGEPTLYPHLTSLMEQARSAGMNTTLVSNGIPLTDARLSRLAPLTNLLVISLDGIPESHDKMRGQPKAFGAMAARLESIRNHGIPFGFLFTLTQYNLNELPWIIDFAAREGAKLVQIHPLEKAGFASANVPDSVPDATEAAYAYVFVNELRRQLGERLPLQLDMTYSETVKAHPDLFYAGIADGAASRPLGQSLSPLVIEADGTLIPLQYGFSRRYALGNLHQSGLKSLAQQWKRHGAAQFEALCHRVLNDIEQAPEPSFFSWYERMAAAAEVDGLLAA